MGLQNINGQIRATFWRGGTSRGLIFSASRLAAYDQATRDAILCAALGSPDPDGRQIDGLGGGASSLSKVALINAPGRGFAGTAHKAGNPLPGPYWVDDFNASKHPQLGWDVVYRFGQVPINGTVVDWGSTCGNLIAAVAKHAIWTQVLNAHKVKLRAVLAGVDPHDPNGRFSCPVRILNPSNGGTRSIAYVPVTRCDRLWLPDDIGPASIAGVPGTSASVVIETPLKQEVLFPTGQARNTVVSGGKQMTVSIIDAGLPVIFVAAEDLGVGFEQFVSHPAKLDADLQLMGRIETLRQTASTLAPSLSSLYFPGSAAPKVCLVSPRATYTTTGNSEIKHDQVDCLIRAVSVAQFHRTVPATTLSALGVAASNKETIVSQAIAQGGAADVKPTPQWALASKTSDDDSFTSVSVGQPAGVSSTCVRTPFGSELPDAIVMERTARILMDGQVWVPQRLFENVHPPFAALLEEMRGRESADTRSVFDVGSLRNLVDSNTSSNFRPRSRRYLAPSNLSRNSNEDGEANYAAQRPRTGRNRLGDVLRDHGYATPESSSASSTSHDFGVRSQPAKSTTHSAVRQYPSSPNGKRSFATSARSSSSFSEIDRTQTIHLYRNLTRAITRNAVLPKHFCSSLQRLVRDDFRSIASVEQRAELARRVEDNLLLLLSASLPAEPVATSPEAQIERLFAAPGTPMFQPAHSFSRRILENLASLTYHHVSPNTLMLSKRRPRYTGGSDAASARVARSRLGKGPSASLAASLTELEASGNSIPDSLDDTESGYQGGSQRLLAPLQTVARPVRGPVVTDAQTHAWDGQRPQKHLEAAVQQASGVDSAQTHARVEAVRQAVAELERDEAETDPLRKMSVRVREEKVKSLAQMRGNLKTARKKEKKRLHDETLHLAGKNLLLEVVQGAAAGYDPTRLERFLGGASLSRGEGSAAVDPTQERKGASPGPLLGAKRWQRWYDGKFLPP